MFYDLIPAKWRKYVYAAFALLMLCWGVWQGSHGDWQVFLTGILSALVGGLAHGNVPAPEDPVDPERPAS